MLDVVFVILHYNTIDETVNCVNSIKNLRCNENIKIIIIDNKSTNGTGSSLYKMYKSDKDIDIILNEKNVGFSRGNNIGYKFLKKKYKTKYVVFCNNDIVFIDKNFIDKVDKVYNKEKFYIMGPDVYNPRCNIHQSPIPLVNSKKWRVLLTIILNTLALRFFDLYWFLIKLFNKKNNFSNNDFNKNNSCIKRQKNVPLMGACLIFSKDFIEERDEVFEPATFMYYEEYILYNWCIVNKKNTIFEPDIMVYHNDGMATASISDTEKNKCRFRMEKILESAKIYCQVLNKTKH